MKQEPNEVVVKIAPTNPSTFEATFPERGAQLVKNFDLLDKVKVTLWKSGGDYFVRFLFTSPQLQQKARSRGLCVRNAGALGDTLVSNEELDPQADLPEDLKKIA